MSSRDRLILERTTVFIVSQQKTLSNPPAVNNEMVGLWTRPGISRTGWRCIGVADLGDLVGACEMCHTSFRYEHRIVHPWYEGELIVGGVCAGLLCGDQEAAKRREERLKSRAGRRARWLTRRWRVSRKGNHFLIIKNVYVTVFRAVPSGWGFCIDGTFSETHFMTERAAKVAAFNELEDRRS